MRSVSYMVLQIKTQNHRTEALVNLPVVAADTSTVSSRLSPATHTSLKAPHLGLCRKNIKKRQLAFVKFLRVG